MSTFWIDVENSSGVKYGDGALINVAYWKSANILDGVGAFEFEIPASDPRSSIVQPKRIVRCYTRIQNNIYEIGSGIIDKITPTIESIGSEKIKVTGDNILRELTYRSVGFLNLVDSSGNGVNNAVAQIMSYAPDGWTIDKSIGQGETISNVYGSFAGENILNSLVKIASNKGEHFRAGNGRSIIWLGDDLLPSGIRAIQDGDPISIEQNDDACIVEKLEQETDTYDICTRIYPYGSGTGDSRLTLISTTIPVPAGYALDKAKNCIINTQAESEYGIIEKYVNFKQIAPVSNTSADLESASNALFEQSIVYLAKHSKAEQFYKLKINKLYKMVYPGQTIRVVFKKVIDGNTVFSIDKDLYILKTTTQIDSSGIKTTDLEVSTVDRYAESDLTNIISDLEQSSIFQTHPQLSANSYVDSFSDVIDSGKPANFNFWLGREVVNIQQCLLRFRIDPLRSTVKTVVGESSTSSAGGGGGGTSSSGGGNTYTSNSTLLGHQHFIPYGESWTYMNTQSHSHSVSIGSHNHSFSIGSHSHSVTPSVSVTYGVYEESTDKTLSETNLIYKVNNSDALGRAVSIGDGWYSLDITDLICTEGNYRPKQESNKITISTDVNKTCSITGKLLIRDTIQAIAVI